MTRLPYLTPPSGSAMPTPTFPEKMATANARIAPFFAVVCLLLACVRQILYGGFDAPIVVSDSFYRERVRPIFAAKCYACHGPSIQESGYRLDHREIATNGGENGTAAILPKNSAQSPLMLYVTDSNSALAMPPKHSQKPRLTAEEIAILQSWIDSGAAWPDADNLHNSDNSDNANKTKAVDRLDWWSFKPLRKTPVPFATGNPIDAFVRSKLDAQGLPRSRLADAPTLARRLYFDLIGLPPSPEEIDLFTEESTVDPEGAWDRLVEKLLAMPQYGERWARHWLDIVHYGDTHGYDKDKPRPNAWPYRDYVIRSFNEDKPYARFVEEQIAGDALWPGTRDGIEALGFISAGPWDFIGHAEVSESKIDGKIARHLDRDDMVSNTIGSFCSLTVHCAQCHHHKFDPISQEDYYRLQAVFSALDRTERKYYPEDSRQKKFVALELAAKEAKQKRNEIEEALKALAGAEYSLLTQRIENAAKSKGKSVVQEAEFGYHSAVSVHQDSEKWVQIDLGEQSEIQSVTLLPCYDDFNGIGKGFGFPTRFKIEVSDDPQFEKNATAIGDQQPLTLLADFKNPGLTAFVAQSNTSTPTRARYVRVTASKLAARQNDFIFALSELQVHDSQKNNIALGKKVAAKDSIEAGPRWRMSNLTDGKHPSVSNPAVSNPEDAQSLTQQREQILLQHADPDVRRQFQEWTAILEKVEEELRKMPPPSLAFVGGVHTGSGTFVGTGATGGKPRPIHVLLRGQVTRPAAEVGPGTLKALTFLPSKFPEEPGNNESLRRVALAKWITDPANPLTWRSIVNRVWQYHFGRGLVDSANDFGRNGSQPSHPELLDWLATALRDGGGSIKALHRLIVKSDTYRQSSLSNPIGESIDASNILLWRQNRRRLEAEAIRDSVLAVSGCLDNAMGGPGWQDFVMQHPDHSPHYEYRLADPNDIKTWRRSVYRFIVRSQTQPWLTSLDCADPSIRVDKRNESLSSIQALALLNNGFILTQSNQFAKRLERESSELEEQVIRAYRLALGVPPSATEREQLIAFVKANGLRGSDGLANLCRLLFNLNAFTFVD